jgi:hypothetical protein
MTTSTADSDGIEFIRVEDDKDECNSAARLSEEEINDEPLNKEILKWNNRSRYGNMIMSLELGI